MNIDLLFCIDVICIYGISDDNPVHLVTDQLPVKTKKMQEYEKRIVNSAINNTMQ